MAENAIIAGGGRLPEDERDRRAGFWAGLTFALLALLCGAAWLLNRLADLLGIGQ